MIHMRLAALGTALLLSCAACGTSGDGQQERPIEALYYVSGAVGTQFAFVETADPANCGSPGTGIQSTNSDHQFGDRVFATPHLFVLENNRQPIRAVFRNLDTVPITVNFYLGMTPQVSNVVIQPGECETVATPGGDGNIQQTLRGPKVQVEICSPDNPIDLRTSCLETSGDRSISFFATIGDIRASNITNCLLPPILDACRTPATMFVESPQDQVDAIMSVNPGQNPGGQPTAEVRLEMYLNGNFKQFMAGTNPVVSADL
jgi:hypothetical protein